VGRGLQGRSLAQLPEEVLKGLHCFVSLEDAKVYAMLELAARDADLRLKRSSGGQAAEAAAPEDDWA
jgi:hypothetical protein